MTGFQQQIGLSRRSFRAPKQMDDFIIYRVAASSLTNSASIEEALRCEESDR